MTITPTNKELEVSKLIDSMWDYHGKNAIEVSSELPSKFSVKSGSEHHGYIIGGGNSAEFSNMPENSFIEFMPGEGLHVSADVEVVGGVGGQWLITLYSDTGKRTNHWGSEDSVEAITELNTVSAGLAYRVKGIGEIGVSNIRTATFWSNLAKPISVQREVLNEQKIQITADIFSVDINVDSSVIISCQFFDVNHSIVAPIANTAINPKFGAYHYAKISSIDTIVDSEYSFEVPAGAATAELVLLPWKNAGSVRVSAQPVTKLTVSSEAGTESLNDTIEAFVRHVGLSDPLIIQHTTAPILGHPSLLLRPNRLAKEFADLGAKVIFLPFSRVVGGVEIIDDNTLMVSREHWPVLQRILGKRHGRNNVFICSSFPDIVAVFTSDYLKSKGWNIVYEVRDDMEEFNRVGYSKWFDPMLERRMARIAHQIITVSPRLSGKMDVIANRSDSVTIPNAVADTLIDRGAVARGAAAEAYRSGFEVVGYLGHLTPSWFDWRLVLDAALARPEYKFEIIGHGMPEGLLLPANVQFLGPKSHDEFLDIATRWKVGLIPFKPSTLTFAVDPNKLYEYLAVGLRIVSARMGSVGTAPATFVYKSRKDFLFNLDAAMNMSFDQSQIDSIEEFLKGSNWKTRAATMLKSFRESALNE